jgi:hypothetical protein
MSAHKVGLDGQNGGARMAMKEGWTRDSAGLRSPTGKSRIKKTYGIDCEKCCTNIYSLIKDKTAIAITNAKQLVADQIRSNPQDTHIYEMNPYTNIYELIEELKLFQ